MKKPGAANDRPCPSLDQVGRQVRNEYTFSANAAVATLPNRVNRPAGLITPSISRPLRPRSFLVAVIDRSTTRKVRGYSGVFPKSRLDRRAIEATPPARRPAGP